MGKAHFLTRLRRLAEAPAESTRIQEVLQRINAGEKREAIMEELKVDALFLDLLLAERSGDRAPTARNRKD